MFMKDEAAPARSKQEDEGEGRQPALFANFQSSLMQKSRSEADLAFDCHTIDQENGKKTQYSKA